MRIVLDDIRDIPPEVFLSGNYRFEVIEEGARFSDPHNRSADVQFDATIRDRGGRPMTGRHGWPMRFLVLHEPTFWQRWRRELEEVPDLSGSHYLARWAIYEDVFRPDAGEL